MDSSNLSIPLYNRISFAMRCSEGDEEKGGRYWLNMNFEPLLQNGPQCGIVALVNGYRRIHSSPKAEASRRTLTVEFVFAAAKECEFSNNGEMFSPFWLADLANIVCESIVAEAIDFPSTRRILEIASCDSAAILIPYDCEKNGEPGTFEGHKAHWCLIVGCLVVSAELSGLEEVKKVDFEESHCEAFVFGLQGKSRYPGVWSVEALRQSNAQLRELGSTRLSDDLEYRLPGNGVAELCGKCVLLQMAQSLAGEVNVLIKEPEQGWSLVKKSLPRILEYGREEGIIAVREQQSSAFSISGVVMAAQEEAPVVKEQHTDNLQLQTNDITLIHEAIPFLPVPAAAVCLMLNVLLPGSGSIVSGFCALCMGQPRINMKEGRKLVTLILNCLVGVSQFFTIPFLFVGWFWSIAWGGLIIIHSMHYREALQNRRQEAVATAAIEALTKDSILHRRDVKTLIKEKNIQGQENKKDGKKGKEKEKEKEQK